MIRFSDPEPLRQDHRITEFDSGVGQLDSWLQRYASQAAAIGSARTYITRDHKQQKVVGYYALTVASIEHEQASSRVAKGMPCYPIPVVVLARLAVDRSVQGRGLGAWLLRDAMLRTVAAADEFGIRAMLAHALSGEARAFYQRWGFKPSPTDPLNLQVLIGDIRKALLKRGDLQ